MLMLVIGKTKKAISNLIFFRESPRNVTGWSSEEGTCSGIPSGLMIEMLVTEAGKYAGEPQMEIIGTKIRYV